MDIYASESMDENMDESNHYELDFGSDSMDEDEDSVCDVKNLDADEATNIVKKQLPQLGYTLDRSRPILGQGCNGIVYLIKDRQGNKYALKILFDEYTHETRMDEIEVLIDILDICDDRFICIHPFNQSNYDMREHDQDDQFYKYVLLFEHNGFVFMGFATKFKPNLITLKQWSELNRTDHSQYMKIMKNILRHLITLENRNIIHRDLHSENILIDHITSLPYIIDFGIARKNLNLSNEEDIGDIKNVFQRLLRENLHIASFIYDHYKKFFNEIQKRETGINFRQLLALLEDPIEFPID